MFRTLLHNTTLARTLANRDGLAAFEFALIALIMIALYVGLAEVSLLVTADRNVSHAASITGDLATQIESLDTDEVDGSGVINEVGYAKLGSGLTTNFDASDVNPTLLNATSGLVVTRVSYNYKSPSREFVGTPTLSESFMLKPRKYNVIPFINGAGSTIECGLSELSGKIKVSCT